jgi:hypothetical protein
MLSFFLGVPDPHLGVMRLVIIVGMVYGIIFGFFELSSSSAAAAGGNVVDV